MKTFAEKLAGILNKDETMVQLYARIFGLFWNNGWNELNRDEIVISFRDEVNTLIVRHSNDSRVQWIEKTEVEKEIDAILEICLKEKIIETMKYDSVTYYCIPEEKLEEQSLVD